MAVCTDGVNRVGGGTLSVCSLEETFQAERTGRYKGPGAGRRSEWMARAQQSIW
jgi:hypothetical protein